MFYRSHGFAVQIRHQPALQLRELAKHSTATLLRLIIIVNQPRHAVRIAPVQARVRAEKSKLHPALVDRGVRVSFESADVDAPERESAHAEGKTAAQRLRHCFEGAFTVAAPVYGEALAACTRRASEENCFIVTVAGLQRFEDKLVEQEGVVVVHLCGIDGGVVPLHICWRS